MKHFFSAFLLLSMIFAFCFCSCDFDLSENEPGADPIEPVIEKKPTVVEKFGIRLELPADISFNVSELDIQVILPGRGNYISFSRDNEMLKDFYGSWDSLLGSIFETVSQFYAENTEDFAELPERSGLTMGDITDFSEKTYTFSDNTTGYKCTILIGKRGDVLYMACILLETNTSIEGRAAAADVLSGAEFLLTEDNT